MDAPFPLAGETSAVLSSLAWATGAVLFTRLPAAVTPGAINLGKNVVGSLCFLVLWLATPASREGAAPALASVLWLVASGVVGLAVCDLALLRAFRTIGPRRVNVVMALCPALVALLAFLPPLFEHPGLEALAGMAVCLTGLLFATRAGDAGATSRTRLRAGLKDALAAAVLQAVGIVLTRLGMAAGDLTVTEGAAIRLLAGTVGLALLGLPGGRLGRWVGLLRAPGVARQVLVAALVGTVLGIWTNQAAIAWATHVGVAATLNALAPVWLVPLSRAFLGERHDRWAWASAALAVAGIGIVALG